MLFGTRAISSKYFNQRFADASGDGKLRARVGKVVYCTWHISKQLIFLTWVLLILSQVGLGAWTRPLDTLLKSESTIMRRFRNRLPVLVRGAPLVQKRVAAAAQPSHFCHIQDEHTHDDDARQ